MGLFITGNGFQQKIELDKGMELAYGLMMARGMKDYGWKIKEMAKELWSILMRVFIKENGKPMEGMELGWWHMVLLGIDLKVIG